VRVGCVAIGDESKDEMEAEESGKLIVWNGYVLA
jgi:hypothetical protein